jgi:transposase
MKQHTRHSLICHSHSGSPFFDEHFRPDLNAVPFAVLKLAVRYGISISHATLVARLAGLGGSEVR